MGCLAGSPLVTTGSGHHTVRDVYADTCGDSGHRASNEAAFDGPGPHKSYFMCKVEAKDMPARVNIPLPVPRVKELSCEILTIISAVLLLTRSLNLRRSISGCAWQDYMAESDNLLSLHSQIKECDVVLTHMEQMLGGFQVQRCTPLMGPVVSCSHTVAAQITPQRPRRGRHAAEGWPILDGQSLS